MKKKHLCVWALALMLMVSGCAEKEHPEKLPETQGETVQEQNLEKDPNLSQLSENEKTQKELKSLPLDAPLEKLEVYRYWAEGKVYSPKIIDFADQEQTVESVLNTAASAINYVSEKLPVNSLTLEENGLTIDLQESFLEIYSKEQLEEIQNTIAATLFRNKLCDSVCFSLDGNQEILGGKNYQPAEFSITEVNQEEMDEIVESIPYPGIVKRDSQYIHQLYQEEFGIQMDEKTQDIVEYLTLLGKLEDGQISPERVIYHGIQNTIHFTSREDMVYAGVEYLPQLGPVAESVSVKLGCEESLFWIADHVRQSIQYVMGEDYPVDFAKTDLFGYCYFEEEGAITPPHIDGGYEIYPIVRSYEEKDGKIEAEVVYLFGSMDGIAPWGDLDTTLEQRKDYIQNTDEVVRVTLSQQKDGRLIIENCQQQ